MLGPVHGECVLSGGGEAEQQLLRQTEQRQAEVKQCETTPRELSDFPKGPVEKPVNIRNIGEKTTKWKIKVPSGFELSEKEAQCPGEEETEEKKKNADAEDEDEKDME